MTGILKIKPKHQFHLREVKSYQQIWTVRKNKLYNMFQIQIKNLLKEIITNIRNHNQRLMNNQKKLIYQ